MEFLKNFILGLISGFTEFLPISSSAHQQIFATIFGVDISDPVRDLFIHIAVFLAVYVGTAQMRDRLNRANRKHSKRNPAMRSQGIAIMEKKLIHIATLSFLVLFFVLFYLIPIRQNLLIVSFTLLINGILIYLPERMLQGNKNAKVTSTFDAVFIGIAGALSAYPGFSRIGCMITASALRGAEKKSSANWALLLSLPALIALICVDVISLFSGAVVSFWSNLLFYLIAGVAAYFGSLLGIYILRRYIRQRGCTGYAYYCWGTALFSLILFLTVI